MRRARPCACSRRSVAVAALHLHLRDLGGEEPARRAVLIPLLDILQSVPVLGFMSVTVVFFMALFPGRVLGAEFAAVFAIFTSQAWNMAFSFYQSLRTVPPSWSRRARSFRLSAWQRFWRLEVPFAMPALVWNMMMSMSGGWFFVVASEAISVGDTTITLPGVGSYIALAIEQRDLARDRLGDRRMLVVILIYDQLLFRPLVAWADRFRFEQEAGRRAARSWVLTTLRRSRLLADWPRRSARPGDGPIRPCPDAQAPATRARLWRRGMASADRSGGGSSLAPPVGCWQIGALRDRLAWRSAEVATAFGSGC